jgi:MATE family multidrug resistance protein
MSPTVDVPSETTPLIANGDGESEQQLSKQAIVFNEFWLLFRSSIPVVLGYALQNSLQTASVLIVGRLSKESIATAAFSFMFSQVTAFCIALGGTTAIDTLGSSVFTASKDPREVGIILQRAFIVLTAFYVPIVVLWIFSEPVFLALGQEDYIARDSARFLITLIPGGLGYIYFECVKKLLQACEIPRAGTYVLCITSPLNILLNYLFVYTFNFGLLGAPIATSISYWLSFLLILAYMRFVDGKQYWGGWDKKAFKVNGLITFARLAGLGFIHIGTEWWAFEIVAIVAGQLGVLDLAAQSVSIIEKINYNFQC